MKRLLCFILLCFLWAGAVQAQYTLRGRVVSSFGMASDGSYRHGGTAGDVAVGGLAGGDYTAGQGFWYVEAVTCTASGCGVVLPVELVAFEAVRDGAVVHLAWQTASETDNAGFEVQARDVGTDQAAGGWHVLGFVEGGGTTLTTQRYAFTDAGPGAASARRYRLKQVDYDGTFAYSPEVEVAAGVPVQYRLHGNYPNPFNPATTLRFDLPQDAGVVLYVYDVQGREVVRVEAGTLPAGAGRTLRFEAEGLASGLYVYRLAARSVRGVDVRTGRFVLLR